MTKRQYRPIAAMLILACVACACGYSSVIQSRNLDSEVIQAALASTTALAGDKYLIVASAPHPVGLEREWIETHLTKAGKVEVIPIIARMLTDYEERNGKVHLPTNLGSLNARFIDEKTLAEMFTGDMIGGWKKFRANFPGAYALIDLSLPGYSPDRDWAVLCYSVSRGSLSQEVWVALLHKKSEAWVVEWRGILDQS